MIYLWQVFTEEPLKCKSEIDEYYHREAVTKLLWVHNESITSISTTYNLMSTSTDGKILVWKPENKFRFPVKGHLLSRKKGGETQIMGGTALCKGSTDDTTYLVGTEGGSLFKCNIHAPIDKDVSHLFDGSKVRWKHEA